MAKIIFFQPHPDDLEFNCGHLIHYLSKKSRNHHTIKIASITKGEFGLPGFKYDKFKGKFLAKVRTKELFSAMKIHDISPENIHFLGYVDGFIKFNREFVQKISEYLNKERPDLIFAPEALHTWYYHLDHVNTGKAIFYIIFKKLINFNPILYFYGTSQPNFFFGFKKGDISLIEKLLRCHKTQYWLINRLKLSYKLSTRRAGLSLNGWNYAEKYRRIFFLKNNLKKNNVPLFQKILTHWFSSMPWFKAQYPKEILEKLRRKKQ
ncbi:MAG: PIG-L deacetylase family protein [Candidatus Heimdallarchaeota archaeon]